MASVSPRSRRRFITELPSEVLLHILSHLPYRALCRIGVSCRQLHELSLDETLWRQQCLKEFLVKVCNHEEGWLQQFKWHHARFGRHHDSAVYRTIRRLWDRMEKYLGEHDEEMLQSLRVPCDFSEIKIAEQKMNCRFPSDLRCSLQIHNGQQMGAGIGLYGCMAISTYFRSEGLLDATAMARHYDNEGDLPGCVPLTYCYVSRKSQFISVSEEGGFTPGEVFYPTQDEYNANVDIFITGKSFTEWFTELVDSLEARKFPSIDGRVFRFHNDPECVSVTRDCFKVTAATSFMPDLSTINPPHFFFTYRVTMTMDKDASRSESCQLETRHWIITDEDGDEETVVGPGVVGEFPEMTPGSEYSWISCTTFSKTYGNMRGHFTMRNQNGDEIEITCPTFHMKCLPYKTASERHQQILRRKKDL